MTAVSPADIAALRASGLFDEQWYLEQYPDVRLLGMDPAEHYLWVGKALRRKPSAEFDGVAYSKTITEMTGAGNNPRLHYVTGLEGVGSTINGAVRHQPQTRLADDAVSIVSRSPKDRIRMLAASPLLDVSY